MCQGCHHLDKCIIDYAFVHIDKQRVLSTICNLLQANYNCVTLVCLFTLLVAPYIIVAHGLSYTLSNCMRHEWTSVCMQKSHAALIWSSDEGSIILHGPKAWCMVSCTTPVSQSECRKSGSTSTKGNKRMNAVPRLCLFLEAMWNEI